MGGGWVKGGTRRHQRDHRRDLPAGNVDATKSYPVIDHVYPGPVITPVPKEFVPTCIEFSYRTMGQGQGQALAELGVIVD